VAEAPRISLRELRGYIADAGELAKGTQIADGGALTSFARHDSKLFCEAKGSGQAPYRVSLSFGDAAGELTARCSCMASRSRPFCKHAAGLLVAWARSPESFVVSEAPPATAETAAKKKSVKTGKVSGSDLMKQGVERVATLVRELAVAGVATVGLDRVEQVRQLGESLRENRLRRLAARTLDLADRLEAGVRRRERLDAVTYAEVLADMLLTARKLERHLGGEALEDRHVEELIGKTWRKTDRTPVEGLDLVEYAFITRTTSDDYVIRESRFVDVASGLHYSEKQILPAFLAKRTEPKRSYTGGILRAVAGGLYPGFAPHRIDLETVPTPAPLEPTQLDAVADKAHASVAAALAALQEHRRDVFAPDTMPVGVRADLVVADNGRFRLVDGAGDALHLSLDTHLDEALTHALRRGPLRAVLGDLTIDGILAALTPMAVIIAAAHGSELITLGSAISGNGRSPRRGTDADDSPVWLEAARQAGAPAAAIALGEVRLEMAEALVTGLAGLVTRVTDPLAARLRDLGLERPAAVLGELPAKPEATERLDGFVRVHQIVGLALVRLASATSVAGVELERLPTCTSIAIRRPSRLLSPEELLEARMQGRLSRHEVAWHRAKHFESLSVDELIADWPSLWSDGESAPFIARALVSAGEGAANVAGEILGATTSGRTAQLTAVQVLQALGGSGAAALAEAAANKHLPPVVRARAGRSRPTSRGLRGMVSSLIGAGPASIEAVLDRLSTSADKDGRLAALNELEQLGDEQAISTVRRLWLTDPAQDVRARAAVLLGELGDSESVEALVTALRDRGTDAKAALAALGALGDVRAVPELLQAVVENWSGPLAAEAVSRVGLPALPAIGRAFSPRDWPPCSTRRRPRRRPRRC
jgi:hypothetical protein